MTLHTARHIFLLGMMGCGKTATGKALSDLLGYALADTDALIEQYTHQTITELFAQGGEGYFRHIEAACLRCLQSLSSPMVVATGGGTPCFFDNIAQINHPADSRSIYLAVPPARLSQRLWSERQHRPLLQDLHTPAALEAWIAHKIAEREPYYCQATHIIYPLPHHSPADIARYIADKLF